MIALLRGGLKTHSIFAKSLSHKLFERRISLLCRAVLGRALSFVRVDLPRKITAQKRELALAAADRI